MRNFVLSALIAVFFMLQPGFVHEASAQTSGQVTFSFKTVTQNGTYAPKHVLAAWIEKDGVFVKTRLVRANNRKQYLYTWKARSNSNETDAVTGATIASHQTMDIAWDCNDLDGVVVPDGDYVLWVEFTEKHAQGPLTSVTFTKGTESVHLTPLDGTNFINMIFDYIPDGVGVEQVTENKSLVVYPNPSTGIFHLKNPLNEELSVVVYSISGKELAKRVVSSMTGNELDLSTFGKGNFILRITDNQGTRVMQVSVI